MYENEGLNPGIHENAEYLMVRVRVALDGNVVESD